MNKLPVTQAIETAVRLITKWSGGHVQCYSDRRKTHQRYKTVHGYTFKEAYAIVKKLHSLPGAVVSFANFEIHPETYCGFDTGNFNIVARVNHRERF